MKTNYYLSIECSFNNCEENEIRATIQKTDEPYGENAKLLDALIKRKDALTEGMRLSKENLGAKSGFIADYITSLEKAKELTVLHETPEYIIAEDKYKLIVIYRKLGFEDVKNMINWYTWNYEDKTDIPELQVLARELHRNKFKEEFGKIRSHTLEFPEFDDPIWHFDYYPEKDAIGFGGCTNTGLHPLHFFPVDYDFSVNENMEEIISEFREVLEKQDS